MIKAIIIDDEERCCTLLADDLKKYCPTVEVSGFAGSVSSGLSLIKQEQPEVIFLDINLGNESGFDLLEKSMKQSGSEKKNFKVIFTTAYDQYAVKAFRFSALDYLIKPIDPNELVAAVNKVSQKGNEGNYKLGINTLLENRLNKNSKSDKIVLSTFDGMNVYNIENIIRCESQGNYTQFHFVNDKPLLVSKTMKEFENLLKEHQFERIHNSHLININYLKKFIKKDGGFVTMIDGSNLPVAQRKREYLLNLLSSL